MRRIVHISDVHFGPHHLPALAEGVLALIREAGPDLVAISGDLTQRAKPHQFRAARSFTERIPAPVVVVPGNHDVPLYRVWERVFAPFWAYRRHFSGQLEPVFHDEEMVVVGVNTAFNWTLTEGRVTRRQLRELAELCDRLPAGLARIVVLHHPLVRLPQPSKYKAITGARRALELFDRLGVELVLAGHVHETHVQLSRPAETPAPLPFAIAHTGTTTSDRGRGHEHGRNTLNIVTVEARSITIAHFGWDAASGCFTERARRELPRRAAAGAMPAASVLEPAVDPLRT